MKSISICFALIFIQFISIINGDTDDIKITPDEFFSVKNSLNFRGKVALVTGSSSGIGAATVRLLSFLGAKVVVTGRNETRIKEVVKDCWKLSPYHLKPLGVALDLTIPGNPEKLINRTIKTYDKIDILVNSAGIANVAHISDPNFTEIYKSVKIITASAYSMTKNSLIAFAMTLALDMGANVRVNVISPGIIDGTRIFRLMPEGTRQALIANSIPSSALHRAGVPLDIAKTIVFLTSPLAGFITGKELQLDAGAYIPLL